MTESVYFLRWERRRVSPQTDGVLQAEMPQQKKNNCLNERIMKYRRGEE